MRKTFQFIYVFRCTKCSQTIEQSKTVVSEKRGELIHGDNCGPVEYIAIELTDKQRNECALAKTISNYIKLIISPSENIREWYNYGSCIHCLLCRVNLECDDCILKDICLTNNATNLSEKIKGYFFDYEESEDVLDDVLVAAQQRLFEILNSMTKEKNIIETRFAD